MLLLSSHAARRAFLLSFMLFLAGGVLSACNTMEGLGQDTQSLGSAIEDEAEDAQ